jgi:hypothetical protein
MLSRRDENGCYLSSKSPRRDEGTGFYPGDDEPSDYEEGVDTSSVAAERLDASMELVDSSCGLPPAYARSSGTPGRFLTEGTWDESDDDKESVGRNRRGSSEPDSSYAAVRGLAQTRGTQRTFGSGGGRSKVSQRAE